MTNNEPATDSMSNNSSLARPGQNGATTGQKLALWSNQTCMVSLLQLHAEFSVNRQLTADELDDVIWFRFRCMKAPMQLITFRDYMHRKRIAVEKTAKKRFSKLTKLVESLAIATPADFDQRRKAKVELRNMADQVVYQTRRTLEESADKLEDSDVDPVKAHLDELEKMVQDDDGKPVDIDAMDDAAIQAKVKEIEEAMHGVSTKLYEAAAAEMAQQEGGEDGEINVDDGVVDADFATETSNLSKQQILNQAATAMLAQANQSKQSVLSLLQ